MATTKKENVKDYPRPPAIEPVSKRIRVLWGEGGSETVLADTTSAYRVLETHGAPTIYIPPQDVKKEMLKENKKSSYCEWKGSASYYDLVENGDVKVPSRVWTYHSPNARFANIKDYMSFYVGPWRCFIDDEEVKPQPGSFYGGWLSSDIEGPVKGAPGTLGW